MKYKLLYIAPHSFPIRSSESIVNSKLAYALAEAGHQVDVFSVDYNRTYPTDSKINGILSKSKYLILHQVKYKNYDLRKPKSLSDFILSYSYYFWIFIHLGYFYNKQEIEFRLLQAVKKHLKKDSNYDFIITRGFRTELVAEYVKKKYGIKWIANWNDPYPDPKFPPPYGKGPNAKLSYRQEEYCAFLQKNASCHTFPSERLRDYMLKYFTDIKKENTFIIPHMAHSILVPKVKTKNRKCLNFVHTGNVNLPRNPSNFLHALSLMLKEDENIGNIIHCDFYGLVPHFFAELVKELKLEKIIEWHGGVDYFDTLTILQNSDISLIIEAICEEGIYLPTKVVDSLQCRTPIFAISPIKGTLNDLITSNHIGYFADNNSIIAIKDSLTKIINDFKNDNIPLIESDSITGFFEKDIIKQYDLIFKSI